MSIVVQYTHYMPKKWRGKENTEMVHLEFGTLFQYTGMMLLEEMASIFLTPYLLMFIVPKRVDDILQFITDFSVNVPGVGQVCSFSVFDFRKHGNSNYGSPHNATHSQRSSQGKMEKSFLSFQSSYPSWAPNSQGNQFLLNLRTFREQNLQGHGNRHAFPLPRLCKGICNTRSYGGRNRFTSWEMPRVFGNHFGSLWLVDANQNYHPYLLDWCYTSRPHDATTVEVPTEPFEETESCSNLTRTAPCYEEYREDRSTSHLGEESQFQVHNYTYQSYSIRNHWWARSSPQAGQAQTSFFEPPDFNDRTSQNYNDKFSDRSWEDPEQDLDWGAYQGLAKTTWPDDLEMGKFESYFADI